LNFPATCTPTASPCVRRRGKTPPSHSSTPLASAIWSTCPSLSRASVRQTPPTSNRRQRRPRRRRPVLPRVQRPVSRPVLRPRHPVRDARDRRTPRRLTPGYNSP